MVPAPQRSPQQAWEQGGGRRTPGGPYPPPLPPGSHARSAVFGSWSSEPAGRLQSQRLRPLGAYSLLWPS